MKKLISILCVLILLFLSACSKSDVKPPEVSYQAQNEYMNMAIKEARKLGVGGEVLCFIW